MAFKNFWMSQSDTEKDLTIDSTTDVRITFFIALSIELNPSQAV